MTKILDQDSAQPPEKIIKMEDNQDVGRSEISSSCAVDVYPDAQFTDLSQSSQQSQKTCDIAIVSRNDENPCDARRTVSVRTFNKGALNKKERQRRYREKHREELKQREAERRKRQQKVQPNASDSDEAERWEYQQNVQSSANDSNSDSIQPNFNSDLHQDNTQYLEIIQNKIVNDMTECEIYPFIPTTEIKEEPPQIVDPLLENTPEGEVEKDQPPTIIKKEQQIYSPKMCSEKIKLSPKSSTLLDPKLMPANAVLKQLAESGEACQEKKSLQNPQTTTTTSTSDNIVLKRLVFDAEKRCFQAVDSNELFNAMSKKVWVLSVNQEGMKKGISSLNILQKVPPPLDELEHLEEQSLFEQDILQISTDDMCILCARKRSPTHNISHLLDLIKDIAGVNLSSLNLPLRACEDCVADVNVTLKLRNNIKKAYDNLFKKDDTVTINVLPPKTDRQYGTSHIIETDTITSEQTSTVVTEKSSNNNQENPNVSGDNLAILENLNELSPDGFNKIKLHKISEKGDNCGQKRGSVNKNERYMDSDTERICEQLCITNSSQKECKKTDVICKVCNRSFRCLQNLRWHMRFHGYTYDVDSKTFVYDVAKTNHLKQEHIEEEVQKALENMKTEKEKPKSFVPHSSHQTTLNITEDEENKVIAVKEEEIDIEINELR